MANKIEDANVSASEFVSRLSRYATSKVLFYGNNKTTTFATYKRKSAPILQTDKYTVIPAGMEFRPDLMSRATYGVPDLWWKILEANNMKDILEFKAGTNVRLPTRVF
jgi:hypothetical protein